MTDVNNTATARAAVEESPRRCLCAHLQSTVPCISLPAHMLSCHGLRQHSCGVRAHSCQEGRSVVARVRAHNYEKGGWDVVIVDYYEKARLRGKMVGEL